MWSQWPWVVTIRRRVHSRAASSPAIQARHGVAVSIAIASFERGTAMTWTFVATGPTTRVSSSMTWRRSLNRPGPTGSSRGSSGRLELGPDAVERLADHLVGGPLD